MARYLHNSGIIIDKTRNSYTVIKNIVSSQADLIVENNARKTPLSKRNDCFKSYVKNS